MMKVMKQCLLAVGLAAAVGTSSVVLADAGDGGDNSMSQYTGESWAALQGKGQNVVSTPSTRFRTLFAKRTPRAEGADQANVQTASKRAYTTRPGSAIRYRAEG